MCLPDRGPDPSNLLRIQSYKVSSMQLSRRQFVIGTTASAVALAGSQAPAQSPSDHSWHLNYMLPSSMYGYTDLATLLGEVKKIGAQAIDLWPKVHGNQREQLDEMGEAQFAELLKQHGVRLGCLTHYQLGPFGLQDEMRLANRLGCRLIVTGGKGPARLTGDELKHAVAQFAEKMKPHLAVAEETDVTIAIENHGASLMDSADAVKWLLEYRPSKNLAIALAPYHLPQDATRIAQLIRDLGSSIAIFYAWQHGKGSMPDDKLSKEEELLQLPGRGPLDFQPLLAALKDIRYNGWTEIFMHPVPRGSAILPTTEAVTAEINRSRQYLTKLLTKEQ